MGLERSRPVSRGSFVGGTFPTLVALWLAAGCLRPVCEAPGGCPKAGSGSDGESDGGIDAGADAGPDAGSDGGQDGGADAGCTNDSQCPSGTLCDFTCEQLSGNQPFNSYTSTGVCNPNPSSCTPGPDACLPFASYCDFEGRCVPGYCQKDTMLCPQDCTPVDSCGCVCPYCHLTASH
jgi:hypothetical protein